MAQAPGQGTAPPKIYLDIDTAMRRGDMDSATSLARRALDNGLAHPVLFNLRAHWHEHAGRFAAACTDLESALPLSPADPVLFNELGRCRIANGQYAEAVEACRKAIALQPRLASAHYNAGFACEQLGELDLAWRYYRQARVLDPALNDATARLAMLAVRQGNHNEGRTLADQVLTADPGHVLAALALANIDLLEGKFAKTQSRVAAILADPGAPPQTKVTARGFLADALDGEGRTPEAFAVYGAANADLRALFQNRFEGPGKETGLAIARRLARELEDVSLTDWSSPPQGPLGDTAGLAFLMGFPRSGTTLLGQVLAAHPGIVTLEEKPLLGAALQAFILKPGGLAALAALTPAQIAEQRALVWAQIRNEGVTTVGRTVVDQTPLNTMHLPVIARLFPDAKVIFALRDPRDVVLSCFRRLFALNIYVYEFLTLEGTARFYDAVMALAEAYRARLPLPVLSIRNEDLVADFEGQTDALCDFLDIPHDAAMRGFAQAARKRRIATPSAMQVIKGLRSDSIGHWRLYEKELAPVLPGLAMWVERFGYA